MSTDTRDDNMVAAKEAHQPRQHPQRGLTITVRDGVQTPIGGHLITVRRHRGNQYRVNFVEEGPLPCLPQPATAIDPS